jgi:hypothetical protein
MRRWHALPVAALVAIATAAGLFSAVTPGAEAGGPTIFVAADCGSGPGVSCTLPTGTTTVDVDVVFVNNSASPVDVGAFNFTLRTVREDIFDPAAASNPEFNAGLPAVGSSWACSPPPPNPDQNADPVIADSFISCFEGNGVGTVVAASGSVVLGTVHYNVSGDGQSDFDFQAVSVGNAAGDPLVDCGAVAGFAACTGTNVTVGVAGPSPTPTNTNTPIPATNTPCDPSCPPTATGTSLAFVTITPTPGGETATPVPPGGEPTTAPGGGGEPGGGGQQPGGGTGAGGGRPITLPDTGANGGGGIDWSGMSLVALIALAAGAVAGGTYYYAARRVTAGRDE